MPYDSAKSTFPRLALVGCGNIVEKAYLPALKRLRWAPVLFVDPALDRAAALARTIKGAQAVASLEAAGGPPVEAVIVAAPHRLHQRLSEPLLMSGVHVLVEKPMATSVEACDSMLAAASAGGATLSVGHFRRFATVLSLSQQAMTTGALGEIQSFSIDDGNLYDWDMKTDSLLRREDAGGGVLMDLGSHAIDLAVWCFPGVEIADFEDDNMGGIESEARVRLRLPNGGTGLIRLSRNRELGGTLRAVGTRGTLEVSFRDNCLIEAPADVSSPELDTLRRGNLPPQPWTKLFELQLRAFATAARTGDVAVPGADARAGVALIEQCYRVRRPLHLPWLGEAQRLPPTPRSDAPRWLITGATGFIGGRIVEKLLSTGEAAPRCLVHRRSSAVRISRHELETTNASLTDVEALAGAVAGCDAIIHCAHDSRSGKTNMEAVENLVVLAARSGVNRVVHISSMSVYEPLQGARVDEECPRERKGWSYHDNKLETEQRILALGAHHGVNVVVLQPTIVYGPYSRPWTIAPVTHLLQGGIVLPDEGEGICNAVYVDDVADAAIQAASSLYGAGDYFLVTGPDVVTWRRFYEAFDGLVGGRAVKLASNDEFRSRSGTGMAALAALARDPARLLRAAAQNPVARNAMSAVFDRLPERGQHLAYRIYNRKPGGAAGEHIPQGPELMLYQSRAVIDATKAKEVLGINPQWSFDAGFSPTANWVNWAYKNLD